MSRLEYVAPPSQVIHGQRGPYSPHIVDRLCHSFLSIMSARCTDIGRTLLVGVISVLSVMFLPDCLCCTGAISRKPTHVVTKPLSVLPQTINLLWGILYPIHGESAVGMISVAPV